MENSNDMDFNLKLYQEIGNAIKKRRKELNIKQSDLVSSYGKISRSSLSNIEKGKQKTPIHVIYHLCKALDIDIHEILPTYSEIDEKLLSEKNPLNKYMESTEIDDKTTKLIKNLIRKSNK